jgi:hypothetical protein
VVGNTYTLFSGPFKKVTDNITRSMDVYNIQQYALIQIRQASVPQTLTEFHRWFHTVYQAQMRLKTSQPDLTVEHTDSDLIIHMDYIESGEDEDSEYGTFQDGFGNTWSYDEDSERYEFDEGVFERFGPI